MREFENDEENDDRGFFGSSDDNNDSENPIPQKTEGKSKPPKKTKPIGKRRGREKGSTHGILCFTLGSKKKESGLLKEASRREAQDIIEKMDLYYEEDLKLINQNKPANKKLIYSAELDAELKNVSFFVIKASVCEQFIEFGGLSKCEKWLRKLPNKMDPSLTLKKKIFNILLGLNIKDNQINHIERAGELQKIIQKNKRSVTKDLRDLSEAILLKWEKAIYEIK